MVDPLKELDKALGIVSDVDKLQNEPWNYEHKPKQEIIVEDSPMLSGEEWLGKDGLAEVEANIEADYIYQRETFYTLVEKGSTAIDGILELAKEGEHPRGYEVAGNLIKQVAEVTEKLGDLQEKMKRLKEVPDNAPKNVTNALFVGSTAELQKLIKGKKSE
jgi:hypothetical protein|tara:strand:+ start:142 stop:624 length:483 start_codon:yes stop_codon:yes gene_type:complete